MSDLQRLSLSRSDDAIVDQAVIVIGEIAGIGVPAGSGYVFRA